MPERTKARQADLGLPLITNCCQASAVKFVLYSQDKKIHPNLHLKNTFEKKWYFKQSNFNNQEINIKTGNCQRKD
jgi:hypothetical protein